MKIHGFIILFVVFGDFGFYVGWWMDDGGLNCLENIWIYHFDQVVQNLVSFNKFWWKPNWSNHPIQCDPISIGFGLDWMIVVDWIGW